MRLLNALMLASSTRSYEESYAKEEPPLLHPVPSLVHLPDEEATAQSVRHRHHSASTKLEPTPAATESASSELPEAHTYDADVLTKGTLQSYFFMA